MSTQTTQQVRLQLIGMGCTRYEIGILDPHTNRMQLREWTIDALRWHQRHLGYLAYRNTQGCHIYIRPSGPHALTLLDDLDATALSRLDSTGFQPALVVQTSPHNYQAWLKHPQVLTAGHHEASSVAARLLASRFGGDLNSADWRHFGRLAGYTNRKPKYRDQSGQYPFVRVVQHRGTVYSNSTAFLAEVQQELERLHLARLQKRSAYAPSAIAPESDELKRRYCEFQARYTELHRADFAFALWGLGHGLAELTLRSFLDENTTARSAAGGPRRRNEYLDRTVANALKELRP
jgi:hypothetical protein